MLSTKCVNKSFILNIYVKEDLALNNLQWFIRHKTQPNQIIYIKYICRKSVWH